MKKKEYDKPRVNISIFSLEDILVTSDLDNDENMGEWDEL